jgi:hypothetical protein
MPVFRRGNLPRARYLSLKAVYFVGAVRSIAQNIGKLRCARPIAADQGAMWKIMFRNRVLAAGIAGWAASLLVPSRNCDAQQSATILTCTNPMSGTSWQITIDFAKATVDSYPAKISGAKISWFDPADGGNYTLDRKSGDFIASVASSTGGYFRHGRCATEESR